MRCCAMQATDRSALGLAANQKRTCTVSACTICDVLVLRPAPLRHHPPTPPLVFMPAGEVIVFLTYNLPVVNLHSSVVHEFLP